MTLTHYVTIPTDIKTVLATKDSKEDGYNCTGMIPLRMFHFCNQYLSFLLYVVVFSLRGETSMRSMCILSTTKKKSFCYAISPVGFKLMIKHSFYFFGGATKHLDPVYMEWGTPAGV